MQDRIITIQLLKENDKEHILFTLDAMIRDAKARQLMEVKILLLFKIKIPTSLPGFSILI